MEEMVKTRFFTAKQSNADLKKSPKSQSSIIQRLIAKFEKTRSVCESGRSSIINDPQTLEKSLRA